MSHDDGWSSQISQASILENAGFRGTFYLTQNIVKSYDLPAWRTVSSAGHEIGNHGYGHARPTGTWQTVANDVGLQEWWMWQQVVGTIRPHTFAHPFGDLAIGPTPMNPQQRDVGAAEYVALLSHSVSGARSALSGENAPEDVWKNRFLLRANSYNISVPNVIS